MSSLNAQVQEYRRQLQKGQIQKAYRGIMEFMSGLKGELAGKHPDYVASSLYFGYMDMTYFALTPTSLKQLGLKVAIVFLHEECRFEVWLAGANRKIQAEYIQLLGGKEIGQYRLSEVLPGVDSILEATLVLEPDFDQPEELKVQIENKTMDFIADIIAIMKETR